MTENCCCAQVSFGAAIERGHETLSYRTFPAMKTIFQSVKWSSLSTLALTAVQTASTSVLYTQTLWRTQDLFQLSFL